MVTAAEHEALKADNEATKKLVVDLKGVVQAQADQMAAQMAAVAAATAVSAVDGQLKNHEAQKLAESIPNRKMKTRV